MLSLVRFFRRIFALRSMIWAMAQREIRYRYAGTFGGLIWSIIHPVITIAVYWIVFSVGLKVRPMGDAPFIIVYVAAYLPWSFFVETLTNSCSAVSGNPHLVKKIAFPTEILPVVHMLSSLVTHCFVMVCFVGLLLVNGVNLSIYNMQVFYYLPALMVFTLGLSLFFAALNVIFRDILQVLNMFLPIWFWLTPIVWPLDMLPQTGQTILKANPLYYIIDGYRISFIGHKPLWADWAGLLLYWAFALLALALGGVVFKRLKPEFADVI